MRESSIPYQEVGWIITLLLPLLFFRVNKWLAPFVVYTWILSVTKTQSPYYRADFPVQVLLAAENQALFYVALLLIFLYMMKCPIRTKCLEEGLAWFGVVNILLTVILTPVNEPFVSGLVLNKPMNSILNLMLLPFVMKKFNSLSLLFFCVATVFVSNSSTALLAMIVMAVWFFRENWICALIVLLTMVVVALLATKGLFQYRDRLDGYLFFFKTFTWSDWVFGRGPGSFFPFGVFEQQRAGFAVSRDLKFGNGLFIWLHSDPLQALYEYGAIGVLTLIPVLFWVVKHTKNAAFYSVLAMICGSLF